MVSSIEFGILNYVILFGYLAIMFSIGLRLAGKQKNTEDYFLAGRKMPWLVVALSMFASLTSAISYMGVPGMVYRENISLLAGFAMSPIVAPFLILIFYPFYRKLKVTTSYEYVYRRYGQGARFTVSGLFLLARLGWLGSVIYVPALALSVVTGMNLYLAITLMGLLATAYTVLGGLSAVLWTDLLQFFILVGGAIWVAVSLILNVPGGLGQMMDIAAKTNHLQLLEFKFNLFEMTGIAVLISSFFVMLQDYGTDQVTVQRLLAVKTFRGMAKAVVLNSFFDLFIMNLLLFLGLGLFAYYHLFPSLLPAAISEHTDRVLPFYIMQALPNGISGLIITGIFAAAMSSMDSGINSLSTVVVNDFIKPLRHSVKDERADVKLARLFTLLLGLFATAVAFYVSRIEHIIRASSIFVGLFSGPILALFLMGIFSKRANFRGWLVGTVVSVGTTLWLIYGIKIHWIYFFPFSFGISLIIGYLASFFIGQGKKAEFELTIWGCKQR